MQKQEPTVESRAFESAQRQVQAGRIDLAVGALSEFLLRHPGHQPTLKEIARLLLVNDQIDDAIEVLEVIVALDPADPRARRNLGIALARTRKFRAAEMRLSEAAKLDPKDFDSWMHLARVREQIGQFELAQTAAEQAAALRPDDVEVSGYLMGLAHHSGRSVSVENLPPDLKLLSALTMPVVPRDVEEIRRCRDRLKETLEELVRSGAVIESPQTTVCQTTFHLGYHGLTDRPLVQQVAETLAKVSPQLAYVSPHLDRPDVRNRRIKIGFVSSFFRNHSVGRVLNRFIKELDRERFEVVLFELPGKYRGGQEVARSYADRTVFLHPPLESIRAKIENESLDVLLFGDISLDPLTDYLAYSRLAPVQFTTWGHPGTSGRPSIDYWVSCEDWEPPGNESLYTEQLVCLKAPPMIATRLPAPETIISREALGLPDGRLYACPQSLYKLHPEFDAVLGEVLRRDPGSWLVLIDTIQSHWRNRFETRFKLANPDVADRIVMLKTLDTDQYLSLLSHCEVSLDPIHFGGANTSMEAFTMGLPVVTLPGTQLRNRQTLAFYRMMGMTSLVVETLEEYVELSVRIARDKTLRTDLSRQLVERSDVLFDTVDVTRELEAAIEGWLQ